jgi:hypothetical protein
MVTTAPSRLDKTVAYAREHGARIGLEVLVNFVGPFVIYSLAKPALGDVNALIASSAPPIGWSIFEFIKNRRVDALSMLVLAGIGLSLLAFIGGGGVKFLQLREKLVTALIGLIFLGSAAFGYPLMYQLARASSMRRSPDGVAELEALRDNVYFRRTMLIMTLVWGFGLVADAAAGCVLVFVLSIRQFMVANGVLGYGTMGALGLWTAWYARRQRARGRERMAAAQRAAELAGEPKAPPADHGAEEPASTA